jgi:Xaa-Pro aminopeptidase
MFPQSPHFITDDLPISDASKRYTSRRNWILSQCKGPLILLAPDQGPDHGYPWAHVHAPVFQDSYFLFLTGINQPKIALILDPKSNKHHLFLPEFNADNVFWNGPRFAYGDPDSTSWLKKAGYTDIHPFSSLTSFIRNTPKSTSFCLNIDTSKKKMVRNEAFTLKQFIIRQAKRQVININDHSWDHRLRHDTPTINAFKTAVKKTNTAFKASLCSGRFKTETELSGTLMGHLFSQSCYGIAFPPIIAKNENAAILHYINNSSAFLKKDLVLLDFGLRWQSIHTDISRTIPISGTYTDLQKRLISIVLDTQDMVMSHIKPGITMHALNKLAWDYLDHQLGKDFLSKGGSMERPYALQPHNIGHLLGIQVHDGPPDRRYMHTPLPAGAVLTIEPGLYGTFHFKGESLTCGIRIEDNILITDKGFNNLSKAIPKSISEIEALFKG